MGFDSTDPANYNVPFANRNVAFTVQYPIAAGEQIVHGSLALSLQQLGSASDNDRLELMGISNRTFTTLGWLPLKYYRHQIDGVFQDELKNDPVLSAPSSSTSIVVHNPGARAPVQVTGALDMRGKLFVIKSGTIAAGEIMNAISFAGSAPNPLPGAHCYGSGGTVYVPCRAEVAGSMLRVVASPRTSALTFRSRC